MGKVTKRVCTGHQTLPFFSPEGLARETRAGVGEWGGAGREEQAHAGVSGRSGVGEREGLVERSKSMQG